MLKMKTLKAILISMLGIASTAHAVVAPDIMSAKNSGKDATLITTPNSPATEMKNPAEVSQVGVFFDTLLGKNIDEFPEDKTPQ